jgi:hypothetical protein
MSSDPEKIEEQRRQLRLDARERVRVVRDLLQSKGGRKFLWWILAQCEIFSSSVGEERVMAFREGKRNIGLRVWELVQADPANRKLFLKAQDENAVKGTEE